MGEAFGSMATISEPETTMRVSRRTFPLPSRAVLTAMTTRFSASASWPKRTIASNRRRVVTRIPPPPENNLKAQRLHPHDVQACVRILCQIVVDVAQQHCVCLTYSRSAVRCV